MIKSAVMSLVAVCALAAAVPAQGPSRISFAKGKTSAQVRGAVATPNAVDYVVGARAGQTISVDVVSPEDRDVSFAIRVPAGGYLDDRETSHAYAYNGPVPVDGDYRVTVAPGADSGGKQVHYRLRVSIK